MDVAQPPEFSREQFWQALLGCLLTTQQRSTKDTPVNRFVNSVPYPLPLDICEKQASIEEFVLKTIKNFGGIRRDITIAKEAADNLRRLNRGLWVQAEEWFAQLKKQRSREPQPTDKNIEREAARWADESFVGLGPKQSRNLWQWLGLTRYETPIDGRVAKRISKNLSFNVDKKRLSGLAYHETVVDYVQAVCKKAGVLPCELDAVAFDYENSSGLTEAVRVITESGFVNPNGQITIRRTGQPENRYQLACSSCGHTYDTDRSEIYERRCPICQTGSQDSVH